MSGSREYTVVRALLNSTSGGETPTGTIAVRFLDGAGNELGTEHTAFAHKTDSYVILVAKGDLTKYQSVEAELLN